MNRMERLFDRHGSVLLRVFALYMGATIILIGRRALDRGLVAYPNCYQQPVSSLFAIWLGVGMMVAAVVPMRLYRWVFSLLPVEFRPELPAERKAHHPHAEEPAHPHAAKKVRLHRSAHRPG